MRWFEYNKNTSSGGIEGFLEPINSCEIHKVHPSYSPLEYLTKANKESLVFESPRNGQIPSVVFSADSDFKFKQNIQWTNGMIVTSPHHGSETNKNIYSRFSAETQNKDINVKWVRSDCKSIKRPGQSYLNVKGQKFCTICRKSLHLKRELKFSSGTNNWNPKSTPRYFNNNLITLIMIIDRVFFMLNLHYPFDNLFPNFV